MNVKVKGGHNSHVGGKSEKVANKMNVESTDADLSLASNKKITAEGNKPGEAVPSPKEEKISDIEFIPIISLDKDFKENGFVYLGNIEGKNTILSEHIDADKRNQPLEVIKFSSETVIQVQIKKGNANANDNDGIIEARSKGIKIISDIKTVKNLGNNSYSVKYESMDYGEKIKIKISPEEIVKDAYIDFYSSDDGGVFDSLGKISDVHCGRIGFKLLTNILVLDGNNNPKDEALSVSIKAAKKLNPEVKVVYAIDQKDMIAKIKSILSGKGKAGNIVIFGHGSYFDSGTYIGKDYINTNKEYSTLGMQMKDFLDGNNSQIVLYACHSGVGSTPKESRENLINLAKASKSPVIANMTWGLAAEYVFDGMFSPVFTTVPPNSNADKKPNSVKYLGFSMKAYPNGSVQDKIKIYHTKSLETKIR